ncbi:MAG: S8 family serine peptidase [candidate division WOR-3 bacterium]
MALLVLGILLLNSSPELVRVPQKSSEPNITSRLVWVFFTDKGIFDEVHYRTALATLERSAPAAQKERRATEPVNGFDFNDLPVYRDYVEQIEALGARLRTVSNWLNAASFEMTPEQVRAAYYLPFVYDMKPVGYREVPELDQIVPIAQPQTPERSRMLDTAEAHRFYGPSYDQAQMMGVPELFYKGYFGSGVKLALFDTGLKLKNLAVQKLRIVKQHDFISGDNFYQARSDKNWEIQPIPSLRYLGLVKDPAICEVQLDTNHSSARPTLLAFCADSFAYGYTQPQRAIFYSYTWNYGDSWSRPEPIVVSRPATSTYENLCFVNHGIASYLVYNELTERINAPADPFVYLDIFVATDWYRRQSIGRGRWPNAVIDRDTLYLVYCSSDSQLTFMKFSVVMVEPQLLLTTHIPTGELVVEPQVAYDGHIHIIATGRYSGRVLHFRSNDGGSTFSRQPEPVSAGAVRARVTGGFPLYIFYPDISRPPFTRLIALRYSDSIAPGEWTSVITDSTMTIGRFTVSVSGSDTVHLVFESGGFLYRTVSTDQAVTWSKPVLLDTNGFTYSPSLCRTGNSLLLVCFKRGDDNVVWEASDTLKFSTTQPDHGTRMASIIAGYQPYSIVGIAPGVELIFAKTEFHKTYGSRYYEYNLEEDTYIQALEWAEAQGADVVSTSLGYRGWYGEDQFDGKTAPISIACELAAKRGILIVTAMGNRDSTTHPWPRPYIVAPGDAEGVITAGGVEKNLLPWRGTGTGPTSDGRIKPDLVALSDTVAVVSPDSFNYIDGSVGTSCATALIAGCCALLKEAHPSWPSDSIKAVLFRTATNPVKSCTFGFGVPRVDSAFKRYPPDSTVTPTPRDRVAPFPNPFIISQHQKLFFAIELARPATIASLSIFTISGTLVDTIQLRTEPMGQPGRYADRTTLEAIGAYWDGKNLTGKPAAPGLYIAVLNTTFSRSVAKFALIR